MRVVTDPPRLDGVPHLLERIEPMLVQDFVPQPTIEALDFAILRRLPRIDKVLLDATLGRPLARD